MLYGVNEKTVRDIHGPKRSGITTHRDLSVSSQWEGLVVAQTRSRGSRALPIHVREEAAAGIDGRCLETIDDAHKESTLSLSGISMQTKMKNAAFGRPEVNKSEILEYWGKADWVHFTSSCTNWISGASGLIS